jgi:hypothetical protein
MEPKSFASDFEFRKTVLLNQLDEFAQLLHVYGRINWTRSLAPAPAWLSSLHRFHVNLWIRLFVQTIWFAHFGCFGFWQ